MGEMCSLRCPSCGYHVPLWLGIGFFHPMVLADTQELSKKGKLGATLRRFLAEHPDGVVYPEKVLAQCEKCKEYSSVNLLDMYIPKEEDAAKSNVKTVNRSEEDYWDLYNKLDEQYKLFKEFPHRCGKCHGKVKVLRKVDWDNLKCPHCDDQMLEVIEQGNWD